MAIGAQGAVQIGWFKALIIAILVGLSQRCGIILSNTPWAILKHQEGQGSYLTEVKDLTVFGVRRQRGQILNPLSFENAP